MKKLMAILLTAALLFGLAACDTGASGDASSKASSASSVPADSSSSGTSSIASSENESETASKVVVYPEYDKRVERDYTYDVKVVQGDKSYDLTCYNHCDAVATSERTVDGDMYRRFCEFAFSGEPVRVDITVYSDFDSYTVMPSAKKFRSEINGNVISVYLDKPDYFLLKLDKSDNSILSVFADAPETDIPDKNDPNVIFVEDWYEPENDTILKLDKDNTTLYIAPGAVVNARVKVTASNVTIKGRGMVLDPYSNFYRANINDALDSPNESKRYLVHVTGPNCTIDGIKMIDSRDFNLWVQCTGLKVTNLKILSTQMTTDGITPHQGGGNSFKHCFLYVADNALVLSKSETTSVFDDITIGTICCGIFPQNNAGLYEISNIYIFRADEGVMRNTYTWKSEPRTYSLTLNNVSAVDCDHFPFIFYGYNMGTLPKTITFNNLAVPVATGTNTLSNSVGPTIRVENVAGKLVTNNYTFNFNGLSIGGEAVTDASVLKTRLTRPNTINVTGNGSSFGPALPNTQTVSVRPEGKIFIGERQLFSKGRAVQKDGNWYVPAEDVCKAVGKSVPASTTDINGLKYISLANLVSGKVAKAASYDKATGRINITPPEGETPDLLSMLGNEAHCHWSEYICYNMRMSWLSQYGGNSFRMDKCSANAGISQNLTPQVQQYGKGTYTLTLEAKADTATKLYMAFGVNRRTKSSKNQNLNTQWQQITVTFTNPIEAKSTDNAFLLIYPSTSNAGVEVRNAKLTYNG